MRQCDRCSSNSACGCLHLSFADDVGICALLGVSCSRLSRCQSPHDTYEQVDHICVRHTQCYSRPLCYPLSMTNQRLCPSITTHTVTTTRTATIMTTYSEIMEYQRTTGYEAAAVYPDITGFPENSTISTYASALTLNSERYPELNKYYQVIEIIVNTTGTYTITSSSSMSTYGYLYHDTFFSSHPYVNQLLFGARTECRKTKCRGQNVADKMSHGQNVAGQNVARQNVADIS
ncbi:unnamed protein product, partial [Rotaria sp. Silwood2]